ncbi:MAG: bifunctional UDP-N-acetylglucosamine diphosphorylase/glucosamine-1-phosphate N-acetyltransferase GlmU [Acidimicrobiia bacterium]|nr:MAG: bifunctional UDP-N-acetylglucosamine diphosphorylase/glucosamine-1-phosphate N-acetyltransferase GlmU [Acidimicrobiia bacterium]
MSVGVIVLAAGKGTRMRADTAKVLHTAAGRTLLDWVLQAAGSLDPDEIAVVVGYQADAVASCLPDGSFAVVQEPQNGTGHAARVGLGGFSSSHGTVVVVPGDMPLIRPGSLVGLVAHHRDAGSAATVLTVEMENPHGYGRIVRSKRGITAIVEERDATPDQRTIKEVNTSVYAFDGELLADALGRIGDDNDQDERYLTDVVSALVDDGGSVSGFTADPEEGIGVNTQAQLAQAAGHLRSRINAELLDSGVWMLDPSRVYVDAGVTVAPSAEIYPDTYLSGSSVIGAGARVGPGVQIHDSTIGEGTTVVNSVLCGATVGSNASIGPYAYLRPGALLRDGAKAGTYVEIKNSEVGERSKVPHLSYIGDTTIGKDTNIGAATVTVNYDGKTKHRTTIGDRVRIGSDTMLVAPVAVGDDAFTGAGSVITRDVPAGNLGIERNLQKNIPDYADKRRRRAEGEAD